MECGELNSSMTLAHELESRRKSQDISNILGTLSATHAIPYHTIPYHATNVGEVGLCLKCQVHQPGFFLNHTGCPACLQQNTDAKTTAIDKLGVFLESTKGQLDNQASTLTANKRDLDAKNEEIGTLHEKVRQHMPRRQNASWCNRWSGVQWARLARRCWSSIDYAYICHGVGLILFVAGQLQSKLANLPSCAVDERRRYRFWRANSLQIHSNTRHVLQKQQPTTRNFPQSIKARSNFCTPNLAPCSTLAKAACRYHVNTQQAERSHVHGHAHLKRHR